MKKLDISEKLQAAVGRGLPLVSANLRGARVSGVVFTNWVDMRSADFSEAVIENCDIKNSDISGACFDGAQIVNTKFKHVLAQNVSFRDVEFKNCEFYRSGVMAAEAVKGATFDGFKIPKIKNLYTKIKARLDKGGTLNMGVWHSCNTTHCMAGWVIVLAGEAGQAIEKTLGTANAARLIINKSCAHLKMPNPNFYCDNKAALKFIRKCAKIEAKHAA